MTFSELFPGQKKKKKFFIMTHILLFSPVCSFGPGGEFLKKREPVLYFVVFSWYLAISGVGGTF